MMKNKEKYVTDCAGIQPVKPVPEKETKLTEIVFILDRSGSMSGLEKDTKKRPVRPTFPLFCLTTTARSCTTECHWKE